MPTSINAANGSMSNYSHSPACKKRTLEDVEIQPRPNRPSSQIKWDKQTVVYSSVGQFGKNWVLEQENGQEWSFYFQNLQHYMGETNSLQSAMSNLQNNGYETLSHDYLEQCDSDFSQFFESKNRIIQYPTQTPGRELDAFKTSDNHNPRKPRFVLTIGENKRVGEMFQSFTDEASRSYAIPKGNMSHVNQINRQAIESGIQQLAKKAKNFPEAEFMIVYAGESSIPTAQRTETHEPEGRSEFLMYRHAINGDFGAPVTEKDLLSMVKKHLPNKPMAIIADGCRAGALIAQ